VRRIDLNHFQVATSETARDINRRIVLNLVRKHQPISRADLTRYSGLQRSTVSVITEQLIEERWLREGAVRQLPRGRKPKFLHLNGNRGGIIGVDLRPLTTTIALAGLDSRFLMQESMPTDKDPHQFIDQLSNRICDLMKSHPDITYEGIGVALPGRADLLSQRLIFAPNLGWRDLDIKTPLERATGLPVELDNDANACALAEAWNGQHDGASDLLAVAVTEGIGVGMVLNGQLVRGPAGVAGEFGHVVLSEDGPQCNCGNRGCWEAFASNSAAVSYYMQATPNRSSAIFHAPSFQDIISLAERGDVRAGEAIDKMAHYLGVGIAMLVMGIAPDVIVLFGEITQAWNRVEPIIQDMVKSRLYTPAKTSIVPTDPSTQPRLHGIIALVLQKHFGSALIV
jgi:predicted NBD/HSP70 family sugar kinase